jgi:hypothetical protein
MDSDSCGAADHPTFPARPFPNQMQLAGKEGLSPPSALSQSVAIPSSYSLSIS